MRYITLVTTTILLSSCMHYSKSKEPHSNNKDKVVSSYNEGTLCVTQNSLDKVIVDYYPLSTNCVSSSKIDWKLIGLDSKVYQNSLKLTTYALYKIRHPQIALTNCQGSGHKRKEVKINSPKTLYWGDTKLYKLPQKGTFCFKKIKNQISRVKPIN